MRSETIQHPQAGFAPAGVEQSIPECFAKTVARFPDRIAVSMDGVRLGYSALDRAANRIAGAILARRGDAEEPVCLLFDQGAGLVAGILGALKAGKIYLALDPRHPPAELRHVMEHSGAGLILCDAANRDLAGNLADSPAGGTLDVLDAASLPADAPDPGLALSPGRAAYIFYTSGSTGAPKGVVDTHRNVLHNVMRYTNSLRIGPEDRLSMIQSCSFSGTVSSLFGALLNGATICPFDLQGRGAGAMAAWLAREEVTIFHSVPAIFEQLAATAPELPHLRLIRLEGDRSEPRHVARFQERFGRGCVLVNGLGATETGIVRQSFITHDDPVPEAVVPIGYPVADMEITLLDEDGTPVPEGEIGEIAVASRYLAAGYWRRPDLTDAAFRPDPADPSRRIYRTRDLGRMQPDGRLDHLGRKDFQAKLRGIRIDIAAVEAALHRQQGISHALVMVREDRPGVQQLVAYLTASDGGAPTVPALREALGRALPAIMVPARFVFLHHFPLDRNRKVDRRALPPPGRARPELGTPFAAPRTGRQRAIAACFAEVLGLDEVGIEDDFFALGGDSLLATELLMLVEDRLGVHCPTEFLYLAPTVAGIERSLDREAGAGTGGGGLVALQPEGASPPLFCLHGASGYVLEYRGLARHLAPARPVYGVQSRETIIAEADGRPRPDDMGAAAAAEIRRLQPEGPYHLCGNCFGGVVAIEAARRLRAAGATVGLLALIDTEFPGSMVHGFALLRPPGDYWRKFAALPARDRAPYLATGFRRYFRRLARYGRIAGLAAARRLAAACARITGRADDAAGIDTRGRYRLAPYDGPVTLFSPGAPDTRAQWRRLVTDLEVVEIGHWPGTGRRPHLVDAGYAGELARLLEERIAGRKPAV